MSNLSIKIINVYFDGSVWHSICMRSLWWCARLNGSYVLVRHFCLVPHKEKKRARERKNGSRDEYNTHICLLAFATIHSLHSVFAHYGRVQRCFLLSPSTVWLLAFSSIHFISFSYYSVSLTRSLYSCMSIDAM